MGPEELIESTVRLCTWLTDVVVVVVLVEVVLEVLLDELELELELELVESVELDDPLSAVVGTACCMKGSLLLKVDS